MVTPSTRSSFWHVPYRRNPFFTGRGTTLNQLHQALHDENTVALSHPQGISGLGGVGKTQTALEYAYRYCAEYNAIFWVRADSTLALTSSFAELAQTLELPERNEPDQETVVEAVLRWLRTHTGWLIIFDNLDDLSVAERFLPKVGSGHIVLTTRAHALGGIAQRLEVRQMEVETGAMLLLRRAGFLTLDATFDQAKSSDRGIACDISQELDGLPLAIDQAGAYVKEIPCSLEDYLMRYRVRRQDLLESRGSFDQDYPASVATTWSLSFEKISQAYPAATELLDFCAFLAPDAIPEEIITEGAPHLGDVLSPIVTKPILFDQICREILRFSLFRRAADERTIVIHRLVQAVLKDTMDEQKQQVWISRATKAISDTFPNTAVHENWPLCEQYLPHMLISVEQAKNGYIDILEIAKLYSQAGGYLHARGQYSEAERHLEKALKIKEEQLGLNHQETLSSLNDLGSFYRAQARYSEAEPSLLQALQIREQVLGPNDLDVAQSLLDMGELYRAQSRYEEAEPLPRRALQIREQKLDPSHPDIASSLVVLALLYRTSGEYWRAEPLQQRALRIREQTLGLNHAETALSLSILGTLYQALGEYDKAELPLKQALQIREQKLGLDHPYVAQSLYTLGGFFRALRKYKEAEPLLQRALQIREQKLGLNHPHTAQSLNGVAKLYHEQGKYEVAEQLYRRSLEIREQKLGPHSWDVAQGLNSLATFYVDQRRYKEAESMYRRALQIWKKTMGEKYSDGDQNLGAQALPILERVLGLHPDVARSLSNLAELYQIQNEDEEAEPLLLRALQIREQVFGRIGIEYPDIVQSLGNLAELYCSQGRYREAEPLLKRALTICIHVLGQEHPHTQTAHIKYANLLRAVELDDEAKKRAELQRKLLAENVSESQ